MFNPRAVVLTDLDEVVSQLRANIMLNGILYGTTHSAGGCDSFQKTCSSTVNKFIPRYRALAHCWGESVNPIYDALKDLSESDSNECSQNDPLCDTICIASDVIYDPSGYAPLVRSIVSLLNGTTNGVSPCTLVILAHRCRHELNEK